MIISHEHPEYQKLRNKAKFQNHGCWFYSNEIVENIIPRVKTTRDWNTVGRDLDGMHDHMIVFLHDNSTPWNYEWLKKYKDLVLVCSSHYTMDSVKFSGRTIFLPMNIDTEYVKQFRAPEKTKDTCFYGNPWVLENSDRTFLPEEEIEIISNVPRDEALKEVAKFKRCYAIDRCAQECQVLGCELEELWPRYSCDNFSKVLDNRDAAKILQEELDKLEKEEYVQEVPAFNIKEVK